MKNERMYAIPGWGFSPDIFKHGALADKSFLGMNYFNYAHLSIENIAVELSKSITVPGNLVAWSLGGLFAIKIASLFPDKVRKLILLASQPRLLEGIEYSGIARKAINAFIDSAHQDFSLLKKKFIAEVNFPNKDVSYKNDINSYFLDGSPEQLKTLLKLFVTDLREEYHHLKTKIMHVIGSKDAVLKQEEQCLRALNSNITVAHIPDAGHCGFLTHAKLYRSLINEFINA